MAKGYLPGLLLILIGQSFALLTVEYNGESHDMYGLFSTPYANFDEMKGYLYYYEINCTESIPLPKTNRSILLLGNYSLCILQRLALAEQAGYDGLLSYEQDDSNISIPQILVDTGFPIAIVTSSIARDMINKTVFNINNNSTTVTVSGSILTGILVVAFAFLMCVSCLCCTILWSVICCCVCLDRYHERRAEEEMFLGRDNRTRQELIESILRHLQQMEDDMGSQTPLGSEQTKALPVKKYVREESKGDESCAVCVDEFAEGTNIKVLPCGHFYHVDCIDEWLCNHSSLCPLCKTNVREASGQRGNQNDSMSSDDSSGASGSLLPLNRDYGTVYR